MDFMDQEHLKTILSYDSSTGIFVWKKSLGVDRSGQRAGNRNALGYRYIRIQRRQYCEHRLAWLYVYGEWPLRMIDHINGSKDDNRIGNLRLATVNENNRNSQRIKKSSSRFRGVSRNRSKWQVNIKEGKKRLYLGMFEDEVEAAYVYDLASLKYHGEFGLRNFLPLLK